MVDGRQSHAAAAATAATGKMTRLILHAPCTVCFYVPYFCIHIWEFVRSSLYSTMKGRHHSSASSFPFPFGSRSEAIVRIVFTRIPMANASKKKLAQTPERAVEVNGLLVIGLHR
jgi:hypothetical protein